MLISIRYQEMNEYKEVEITLITSKLAAKLAECFKPTTLLTCLFS